MASIQSKLLFFVYFSFKISYLNILLFRTASVELLDENYVCDSIVKAIRENKRFVMLPPHTTLFYVLKG